MAHIWFTPFYYPGIHIYKDLFFSNLNSFPTPLPVCRDSRVFVGCRVFEVEKTEEIRSMFERRAVGLVLEVEKRRFFFRQKTLGGCRLIF